MIDFTPEQILAAIDGSLGIMSKVAKKLDCSWVTAKTYVNKFEECKEAFEVETEKALDMAEITVFKSIQVDSDVNSAKWFLAKKAKHRGYSDEVKVTGDITFKSAYVLPDGTKIEL
jgi:hypothetical protein